MRSFPLAAVAIFLCALAPISAKAQNLKCKPCSHNYGQVEVGSSDSFSFLLFNTGTKTVRITAATAQGAAFSVGSFPVPVKLKPGASVELPVTFTPPAAGSYKGTVSVKSTDPQSPLNVNISGTGTTGGKTRLTVSPETLAFGKVPVGSTKNLSAKLSASGGDVTISSVATNSSEFVISGLELPVTIPNGQTIQAMIQFTPNASGKAEAKAGFYSNARHSPAVEDLTGRGAAQGSHEADLTWDPGDPDAVGYNVYRGTTHGGPYEKINTALVSSTAYTDTTVAGGNTYYYVTTDVTSEGQESGYSNEAEAIVPN